MRESLAVLGLLLLAAPSVHADLSVPHPAGALSAQDLKAFRIARSIAVSLDRTVDKRCLGYADRREYYDAYSGAKIVHPKGDLRIYNIGIGRFRAGDCPDPHFSIDIVFSSEGEFLLALLNDA